MCGNGLPVDATVSRPLLTIVLTILVVGGLFACAFLYGKWRADVTPMSASVPAFAPAPKARPAPKLMPPPTAPQNGDPAVKPEGR